MKGLPPVSLLLGPEEGEKAAHVAKIRESLGRGGQPPEVTRFYGAECTGAQVVLCLSNQSLFASHRMAIVSDVDQLRRAEDVAALVEYIASPVPDATLVLLAGGFAADVDRKIVAAVPKDAQKVFWEMFDNQKQGWLTGFFRQKGITLTPEAAEYILDMVDNNTRDLRTESERLAQFFGGGATLGLEEVARYVYHSREENVFTLFDRLCTRDLAASADVLDAILLSREAEATQLASGLLAQFRRLAALKRLLEDNWPPADAFPKLRIFSKRNQKSYLEGCRAYSVEELEEILPLVTAFDERLRSVKADLHSLLLHLLLYYIARRAGQGAWRP